MTRRDIDQLLRQVGAQWRSEHAQPLAPPPLSETSAPTRRARRRGVLVPLAAALVTAALVAVAWATVSTLPGGDHHPVPAGNPTATAPGTPAATSSSSASPSVLAAGCTGSQLSAALGRAGPAAGTENILITLRNTSATSCRLGGILPLTGIRPDGTTMLLTTPQAPPQHGPHRFYGTADAAALVDLGHVTGPGLVAPGGYGGFPMSEGLNHCPQRFKLTGFATLRIGLGQGQFVEMPWPRQLSAGCPLNQGPSGPIPDRIAKRLTTNSGTAAPTCQASNLRLSLGPRVSEATGQNTLILVLRNTADRQCTLRGYPTVEAVSAEGKILPFRYRHGSDMMLRDATPGTVSLPPDQSAYVVINKYRCDTGDVATTARLQIIPPGASTPITMRFTGRRGMPWCGLRDPGSTVTVSPVVSSPRRAFR